MGGLVLDINPIKKDSNFDSSQFSQNQSANSQSDVKNNQDKMPLKALNTDYLKKSSTPEPEFLESDDTSKAIFYFSLVAMFLVLAMAGYLYFSIKTQNEELKTKERMQADLEAQIADPNLKEVNDLATRYSIGLDELSSLINNPIQYSLLFDELEKITPTDVMLVTVNIDEKYAYKISAKTNNLESSAKFIKSLEKSSFFETVFLSNNQLSNDETNNYYTISIDGTLDSSKLKSSINDSKVVQ